MTDRSFESQVGSGSEATPEIGKRIQMDAPVDQIEGRKFIGAYRVESILGQGGMGTVYLCSQDIPVRMNVAVKVIKAGAQSRDVLRRFKAERQAISIMNHSNIAKVFESGVTHDGLPFFAMEHIAGEPITQFCDRHRFTISQRLALFVSVCRGIEHAHQKGIIHRDLKPSNILVAMENGEPVPKIIDFGLAMATDQHRHLIETQFTEFGKVIGTVEYMSPEQALLGAEDMDTRTDIYSLGVVLYELLAGCTLLGSEERRSRGKVDLIDAIQTIRSRDPLEPSVLLASMGEESKNISLARQTTVSKLIQTMRGDLDLIVCKSLALERKMRYQSASQLADDVTKYQQHEPIVARTPSFVYRMRKLFMRYRVAFAVGALFAMLLVTATTISISLAIHANNERLRSEEAKQHAIQSLDTIQAFVLDSSVWRTKNPARDQLIDLLVKEYEYWATDPRRLDDRISTIGPAMVRLAALENEVGRYEKANFLARRAIELISQQSDISSPEIKIGLAEAEAILIKAGFFRDQPKLVSELTTRIESRLSGIEINRLDTDLANRFCDVMHAVMMFGYYQERSKQTFQKAKEYKAACDRLLKRFPEAGDLQYHQAQSLSLMAKSIHKGMAPEKDIHANTAELRLFYFDKAEKILENLIKNGFEPIKGQKLLCEVISNRGLMYLQLRNLGQINDEESIENYDKGLEICDAVLAEYPDHLLFQETKGLLLINKADFLSAIPNLMLEEQTRSEAYRILTRLVDNTTLKSEAGDHLILNQLGYVTNLAIQEKRLDASALAVEFLNRKPDLEAKNLLRRFVCYWMASLAKGVSTEDRAELREVAKNMLREILAMETYIVNTLHWEFLSAHPLTVQFRDDPELQGDWLVARRIRNSMGQKR